MIVRWRTVEQAFLGSSGRGMTVSNAVVREGEMKEKGEGLTVLLEGSEKSESGSWSRAVQWLWYEGW